MDHFIELHLLNPTSVNVFNCDHIHWLVKRWQKWGLSYITESRNRLGQQGILQAIRHHRQDILAESTYEYIKYIRVFDSVNIYYPLGFKNDGIYGGLWHFIAEISLILFDKFLVEQRGQICWRPGSLLVIERIRGFAGDIMFWSYPANSFSSEKKRKKALFSFLFTSFFTESLLQAIVFLAHSAHKSGVSGLFVRKIKKCMGI